MRKSVMSRNAGFTLIELMVVVVVFSLLLVVGIPSFTTFVQNNRITAATNNLIAHLRFARSEALRLNRAVMIESMGSTDRDFKEGWRIYTDEGSPVAGMTAYTPSDGDILLREFSGYADDQDLTVRSNAATGAMTGFAGNGMKVGERDGRSRFAVCDSRGTEQGRWIQIRPTGRIYVVNPATNCF